MVMLEGEHHLVRSLENLKSIWNIHLAWHTGYETLTLRVLVLVKDLPPLLRRPRPVRNFPIGRVDDQRGISGNAVSLGVCFQVLTVLRSANPMSSQVWF